LGMRASCRRSFSTKENLLGMSRLFSLSTTRTWFDRRCQTKARRPVRDVGAKLPAAQVPLVQDEGLKEGHDALPASAGCPDVGSYLSASRVGCGSALGCWVIGKTTRVGGGLAFCGSVFMGPSPVSMRDPTWPVPPIEQTFCWVSTRIYARRHSQSKPCNVDPIFQLGNLEAQRVAC